MKLTLAYFIMLLINSIEWDKWSWSAYKVRFGEEYPIERSRPNEYIDNDYHVSFNATKKLIQHYNKGNHSITMGLNGMSDWLEREISELTMYDSEVQLSAQSDGSD